MMNKKEKPTQELLNQWFNDTKNWKLGTYYFNKEDKRLFPPKRKGMGWTINFANPISVFAFILLVLILKFVFQFLFKL